MGLEEGLRAELVNGAVGQIVGDNVHWGQAPQNSGLPYLVLSIVDTNEIKSLSGSSGLRREVVQVDAYASSYAQAKYLVDVVRDSIGDRLQTLGGYPIQGVEVARLRDGVVRPQDGGGQGKFRRTCDVRVWHTVRPPVANG